MRKHLLLFFTLCTLSLCAQSYPSVHRGTVVNLQLIATTNVIVPGGAGHSHPRTPLRAPEVSLDGYTLFIYSSHPDYVLQLRTLDETVVFETFVPENTTEVTLPSDLSGEYELQLHTDSYTFSGFVEL